MKIHKTSILNILFISLLLYCFSALNSFAYATEKIVIKVAYDTNNGIFDKPDSLDLKGFGYDILTRVEHYSNYTFEYIKYNLPEAIQALEKGEIDLIGITLDDHSQNDKLMFIPKVLGNSQLILATKEEALYYDNPQAIDGKTVATFHNSPFQKYLDDYCAKRNISVNYVYGDASNYWELDTDYYLVTTHNKNVKDFSMVMNLAVFPMYFSTRANNQEFADSLAEAINLSISADGRFLEELQLKYYGSKNLTRRYLTVEELALLRSKPLTCGYIDHHQPIQFTDENGNPDGISVEVMNMLAKKFNFKLEYFPYNHDMPPESHENFDILISATGDYEHEIAFYTPSEPFLELPILVFAPSHLMDEITSPDHASILGMVNYITLDQADVQARYPNNTVKFYSTFAGLLEGFKKGEIKGILATENGVEYAQAVLGVEEDGEEAHTIRSTGLVLPLRVFVANRLKNLTEYLGAFNIMFEHLTQTTFDEIVSMQSVSFLPEYTALTFITNNLPLLLTLIIACILMFGMFIFREQEKYKSAILKVINHDDVTQLISLYKFRNDAEKILQTAAPNEYELISIDIDSFRNINKIYSQEKGTSVIHAVAYALTYGYKDTKSLIARVIADQFIIFYERSSAIDIKKICEVDISTTIKSILGERYNISMSIGTCIISDPSIKIDEIIDAAVAARSRGKQRYKFTYYTYDDEIKKEQELRSSIVYRMKDALINNEFVVVYQPKINFKTLEIGGAEALVRWYSKEGRISQPDVFINIFESNGFIVHLDLYVFEKVCKFIIENQDKVDIPVISVNMSAITLFDEKFPVAYSEILKKYNLEASRLEIEVTESAMSIDIDILTSKVKEIRRLGFSLSIDDFGAGESSLNRLSAITVDTIKLDKAFLDYNIAEAKGAIVVDNMIRMAKELEMKVVSEGVETLEQAMWLRSLNCDCAQGYFFEKPMAQDEFLKLLTSGKEYKL